MLKPFMRLFGIDDDAEPDVIGPNEGQRDRRHAEPGPQIARSGRIVGAPRETSEPGLVGERSADARH